MSLIDGFYSLFSGANRLNQGDEDEKQGVVSELLPELALSISDEELIRMKNLWMSDWSGISKNLAKKQEKNENYWKGKFEYSDIEQQATDKPEADNLIFEAVETFLPMATRQNPEAVVDCADKKQSVFVKDKLADMADELKVKLKIKL